MLAGKRSAVVSAASELAIRDSHASVQAVHEAAEGWPRSPRLAAAAVLGRSASAAQVDWHEISASDTALLGLAVATISAARALTADVLSRYLFLASAIADYR